LNARTFVDFGRRRSSTVSSSTVAGELTYAGSALKFSGVLLDAVQETTTTLSNLTAARTVLRHMGAVAASDMRDRRPTEKELRKIRDYCLGSKRLRTPIWEMILFAIATAMRLGEITRIRWEDVDEVKRMVVIRDRKHPTKKQGNDGKIPLLVGPAVVLGEVVDPLEIMRKLSPLKCGRVFPYSSGTTTSKFIYICDKLKINDLHFHDFRHDAVSRLFEYGFRIEQVALVSGHKDWKHLKRYTNINPESLHAVTT
jgi:integrase